MFLTKPNQALKNELDARHLVVSNVDTDDDNSNVVVVARNESEGMSLRLLIESASVSNPDFDFEDSFVKDFSVRDFKSYFTTRTMVCGEAVLGNSKDQELVLMAGVA